MSPSSESLYCQTINRLVSTHRISLLFPTTRHETEILLKHAHLFESSLAYFGSYKDFLLLDRKDALLQLARSLGIRMPKIYDDVSAISFPVVVKPVSGSGAKGVRYFGEPLTFFRYWKNKNPRCYVIQEYIKGMGCAYGAFVQDGKILVSHGFRKIAEYPSWGGSGMYRENFYLTEMHDTTQKIASSVGWSGWFQLEFQVTPEGHCYLIEANPRIWGSIHQALASGVNFLQPLLGSPTIPVIANTDVQTYLSPLAYLAMFGAGIRYGNWTPLNGFLTRGRYGLADVDFKSDIRGFFSLFLRMR